mmetsp:Transcript_50336/g.56248  ORF Transcript_50336/g.56248 Transcript_50336/m.56248 type:complete len:401 (+) Transcript_50336:118-1320(+)
MDGSYCFLDFDINSSRKRLAVSAAFVDSTNITYGFSSTNLLRLGGSEISRIKELISTDHEWSKNDDLCGGIITQPPSEGNRIVIKLYWDVAPIACENFATLCSNGSTPVAKPGGKAEKAKPIPKGDSGKPLSYRGCNVHRVIPGFILQSGDFVLENGSGGECVFKNKMIFKDERAGLNLKHDRFGLLSMGNSGKNSNSSQFFFTLNSAPQCDGKHVIFGECISGGSVLKKLEEFGTANGEPTVPLRITDCGIFHQFHTPGAGFWYDKPDNECWNGVSPTFMVRPRVAILARKEEARQKFIKAIGSVCSLVLFVCGDGDSSNNDEEKILIESLSNFATDIVLISPSCKDIKSRMELPKSWNGTGFVIDEVVLIAKPFEAISVIHTKSWLSKYRKYWHLDGR